jgi:L-seryl-tRNA(Ser) seleniumtransferase
MTHNDFMEYGDANTPSGGKGLCYENEGRGFNSMKNEFSPSRRDLFRSTGAIAAIAAGSAGAATPARETGQNIYQSIGVRPIINCKGTFTIISGSQTLPEVKKAMDEASRYYIELDELMDGVGKRLAELTGAEWGIVTAGCAAAMTHTTSACLAGTDPEKMQRLPNLQGMKSEVVIPKYSRNVYDHATRMLGVTIVEVNDPAELESAFNDRTAMVYILAGPGDEGPLGTKAVSAVAKRRNVPVLVDAAAENLTIPNIHLQRGATLVAYSGGKCIRGPQSAGLLLGDKNLAQAAWANSAPHHAFGRSLKVGKEEIMGMLTAVDMWTKRDHQREWDEWMSWLNHISEKVKTIDGVTTRVHQPESLSNHAPVLVVEWDGARLGITGDEVYKHLLDTDPRIILASGRGSRSHDMRSSISVMPYMMMPGDDKIAADRIYATLKTPPSPEPKPESSGAPANIAGVWDVEMEYKRGTAHHSLALEQNGTTVTGTHRGEYLHGDLHGGVAGDLIHFRSVQRIEGTELFYNFSGHASGDQMSGTVGLGEYGEARWTARRHKYV